MASDGIVTVCPAGAPFSRFGLMDLYEKVLEVLKSDHDALDARMDGTRFLVRRQVEGLLHVGG